MFNRSASPLQSNDSSNLAVLLLSLSAIVPHLTYLPRPVTLFCLFAWVIGLLTISKSHTRLAQAIKTLLTLIGLTIIALTFNVSSIGDASNSLLCLVIALKPAESKTQRSRQTLILICYFSAIAFFFHQQSDVWLLYYGTCLLLWTAFAQQLAFPALALSKAVREAAWLLCQTIPLVLILFFVFPRLSEPLWQWNPYEIRNQSGISDQIELGDLGKLSLSDEVAFTVRFDGPVPDQADLYWRGPIFDFTDGRVWDSEFINRQPRQASQVDTSTSHSEANQRISYRITQQANNKDWLIALDLPITATDSAFLSQEYQLMSYDPSGRPISYELTSALNAKTPVDPDYIYRIALQLPDRARMASRTRALGQGLREAAESQPNPARWVIQQTLRYFSENPFYYSLDAKKNPANPIDSFMFDDRTGYCSHYASSMTMLLRAADIPARMVAGYRGGEWSEIGEQLVVKQKHAHAWVEAWIDDYGWVRIDPTAAIPSDRVLQGTQLNANGSVFSGNISRQLSGLPGFSQLIGQRLSNQQPGDGQSSTSDSDTAASKDLLQNMANQVTESIQYVADLGEFFWDSWVKGFDYQRQQSLLNVSMAANLLIMLVLISIVIGFYYGYMLLFSKSSSKNPKQPVQQIYNQLKDRLHRAGVTSSANMSHQALLSLSLAQSRWDEKKLQETFATYERLRYSKDEDQVTSQELKAFRAQVKALLSSRSQQP